MEQAANAILNQEDIDKLEQEVQESSAWDDSVWTADRNGKNTLQSLAATAPTSRAPTPNSMRGSMHPTTKEDEDQMVRDAMAQSMVVSQQEGGIITSGGEELKNTSRPVFGPAMRDDYISREWALVPASTLSEIIPDQPAQERKNKPGEPRFFKFLPDAQYLANFLTICHAIAGVREAMLRRPRVSENYGYPGDWWKGQVVSMPRIVHTDSHTPADPDADKYEELLAEVQRLMAFLDGSDRSYAMPSALLATEALKNGDRRTTLTNSLCELFLNQWLVAAQSDAEPDCSIIKLFETKTASAPNANGAATEKSTLVFNLKANTPAGEQTPLNELMDNYFWHLDEDNDSIPIAEYVESPASVITMVLWQENQPSAETRVNTPTHIYMDRYLSENAEAIQTLRLEMLKGRDRIRKIDAIEKKLHSFHVPERTEPLDASKLLEHARKFFSGHNNNNTAQDEMPNGVLAVDETGPGASDNKHPRISPDDHKAFMRYAVQQARLSPPSPDKFCVGAVLVDGDSGRILSSGYSLELPGHLNGDPGSTHAEQCCFMKVAQQHGLPEARAEEYIGAVLPQNTVLYTTMEPCNARLSGSRTCCDRIVALKDHIKTVYVGICEPSTFIAENDGKKRLESEGIRFEMVDGTHELCYEAAMAGHDRRPPYYADIATRLDKIITNIDKKLKLLAEEKEKTRNAIREMSCDTLSPELDANQRRHRYTLRGVATKPSITYVLLPRDDNDDEEMDDPSDDGPKTPEGMIWWRLEYVVNGSNAKTIKSKAPAFDVIRAVELEYKEAMLIYASDEVNDIALYNPMLPVPLQDFIAADNELFAEELSASIPGPLSEDPPAYDFGDDDDKMVCDVPRQSIEPHERNSMDSTRVEGAASRGQSPSPPTYDNEAFLDHPGFGLGPRQDIKTGHYGGAAVEMEDAGPTAEIRLDEEDSDRGRELEMVEKAHEPFVSVRNVNGGAGSVDEDTVMDSQDMGIGGAVHNEDVLHGRR